MSQRMRYGRYEAIRPIASGGMATVYLGRALGAGRFQRVVAVKVMHPHIAGDPEFRAMFLDEARLAAGIHHPNVVPTLDVQAHADGLFLVMDYVAGASLHAIIKLRQERAEPPLPLPVALRIFLDMLAGLDAAHELRAADGSLLNVVHRDVSPQNVLVGIDGISRLTDFGVARAEARITSTRQGQIKGKLPYMSPEQLRSKPVDRRTDVYAAGAVFWEMLAGRRLFQADDQGALIAAVLAGPEASLRQLGLAVPAAIDEVCMRALRPVAERFATAAELGEALERAAEASGTSVATPRAVGLLAKQYYQEPEPLPPLAQGAGGDEPADDEPPRLTIPVPVSAPLSAGQTLPVGEDGPAAAARPAVPWGTAAPPSAPPFGAAFSPPGPASWPGPHTTTSAAVAAVSREAPARRSALGLAVAAAGLLAAGGLVAWLAMGGGAGRGPARAPAPAAAATGLPAASVPAAASTFAPAVSSAPAPTPAVTASASAAASAAAGLPAATAGPGPARHRPPAVPAHTATVFHPDAP
ncbi:MAG: serine/threonine protein kinase [Deltaproteobacteria bacterium]|nr:serine/threonine protein kinase [Deltaproteobacteria bacterium]